MAMTIPKEVDRLLAYARTAFVELDIELPIITREELAPLTELAGKHDYEHDPDRYEKNASRIIDYFVFSVPEIVLQQIRDYKQGNFTPNAMVTLELSSKINTAFTYEKVHQAARYLGEGRVPKFIDSEIIYTKLLWQEWLLTRVAMLTESKIIPAMNPLIARQFNLRRQGVSDFLNKYADLNPSAKIQLEQFRAMTRLEDLDESFAAAQQALQPELEVVVEALPAVETPPLDESEYEIIDKAAFEEDDSDADYSEVFYEARELPEDKPVQPPTIANPVMEKPVLETSHPVESTSKPQQKRSIAMIVAVTLLVSVAVGLALSGLFLPLAVLGGVLAVGVGCYLGKLCCAKSVKLEDKLAKPSAQASSSTVAMMNGMEIPANAFNVHLENEKTLVVQNVVSGENQPSPTNEPILVSHNHLPLNRFS